MVRLSLAFLATGYNFRSSPLHQDAALTKRIISSLGKIRHISSKIYCSKIGDSNNNNDEQGFYKHNGDNDDDDEEAFLLEQLEWIKAMEKESEYDGELSALDDEMMDNDDFSDLLPFESDDDDDDEDDDPKDTELVALEEELSVPLPESAETLEKALLEGVVPVGADVGSESLPGDFNFDPLNFAARDYIGRAQHFTINLVPENRNNRVAAAAATEVERSYQERPKALILRDYREAEIRHGRLAMLAAIFWPLEEMLDELFLDENQFGSLVYRTGFTLPFFPLLMTAVMLLLGYLDVYSQERKSMDKIGEAFLPGDCFWDPLSMLKDAPDTMKRNMQERELFNSRTAMLAVAAYFWEELTTGKPLILIPGNELLFRPAYENPFIQSWLDSLFQEPSPVFYFPTAGEVII